jgi:hypothetical protein
MKKIKDNSLLGKLCRQAGMNILCIKMSRVIDYQLKKEIAHRYRNKRKK